VSSLGSAASSHNKGRTLSLDISPLAVSPHPEAETLDVTAQVRMPTDDLRESEPHHVIRSFVNTIENTHRSVTEPAHLQSQGDEKEPE